MRTRIFWVALVMLFLLGAVAQAVSAEVYGKPYEPNLALVCLNADDNPKAAAKLLSGLRIFFTIRGYTVTEDEVVAGAVQKLGITFSNPMPVTPIWNLGREVVAQNIIPFRGNLENKLVMVFPNLFIPKPKSTVKISSLILGTKEIDLIFELEKEKSQASSQGRITPLDGLGVLTLGIPETHIIAAYANGGFSKREAEAMEKAFTEAYGGFLKRQVVLRKMFGPREERYF